MKGLIVVNDNYTYDGEIIHNKPHGYGTYQYDNGDKYVGQSQFGKIDGFGKYYYASGSTYVGYFSYDEFHGIGTYENDTIITKGSWRKDFKHGNFITTDKINKITFSQLWIKNVLKKSVETQYIAPDLLRTTLDNPIKQPKKIQKGYHGKTSMLCIGCATKPVNSVNSACGHVCMCYECLSKCDRCPICRSNMEIIVKLIISVTPENLKLV